VTELPDHLPQHRETDAHDVVVVPLDATHEGATEPVDGEGAGDVQRLAAVDVRRDLLVTLGLAKWTVVDAVTDRSSPLAVSRRQ